jgi:hypothetical protein
MCYLWGTATLQYEVVQVASWGRLGANKVKVSLKALSAHWRLPFKTATALHRLVLDYVSIVCLDLVENAFL